MESFNVYVEPKNVETGKVTMSRRQKWFFDNNEFDNLIASNKTTKQIVFTLHRQYFCLLLFEYVKKPDQTEYVLVDCQHALTAQKRDSIPTIAGAE